RSACDLSHTHTHTHKHTHTHTHTQTQTQTNARTLNHFFVAFLCQVIHVFIHNVPNKSTQTKKIKGHLKVKPKCLPVDRDSCDTPERSANKRSANKRSETNT